jgi:CubicO group peptidase (beta-lactamase class C family)
MRTSLRLLALICILVGGAGILCPQNQSDDRLSAKVDEVLRTQMREQSIPGVSLAVMRDGKIIKAAGYGLANVELNSPVTPQSVFTTCSIAKQFVATGVMMLVEQGKVALDESVAKYLPNSPPAWKDITVRHLLTHTSGVPDYAFGPTPLVDLRHDYTEDEVVRILARQSLDFPPGQKRSYSNSGYVILGALIREVTGKRWDEFLQERIFRPLGMTSTRLMSETDVIPNRVRAYALVNDQWKNEKWWAPSLNTFADGGLYTTVLDMAKWDAALYTEKVIKRSSLEQMWTPVKLNSGQTYPNGLGWLLGERNGHRVVWHDGYFEGTSTVISRYPDDRLTIVVFINVGGGDEENPRQVRIADEVAAIYLPALKVSAVSRNN